MGTRYQEVTLNISDLQKQKIKAALEAGNPVSLKLSYNYLQGWDYKVALTQTQLNSIAKAVQINKGKTIRFSFAQIKYNHKIEGGFLAMLARLAAKALPFLAKIILPSIVKGALTGLASSGVSKLMGNGLYLKKGGNICQVETDGKGLYLKSYIDKGLNSFGNGFFFKQGGQVYERTGLLLGLKDQSTH